MIEIRHMEIQQPASAAQPQKQNFQRPAERHGPMKFWKLFKKLAKFYIY